MKRKSVISLVLAGSMVLSMGGAVMAEEATESCYRSGCRGCGS